jgi:hypothetical protein
LKKTIYTVSGHIGSGKSRSFLKWFFANYRLATFATPTNQLSAQYGHYLSNGNVASLIISQDAGFRSSSEEYDRQCKDNFDGVLLVNHTVALNTNKNVSSRFLAIDEAFSPLETIKIEFEKAEDLADFAVSPIERAPGYYEVVPHQGTTNILRSVINKDGKSYRHFGKNAQELAEYIRNKDYLVVIDSKSFDEASSGESFAPRDDDEKPRAVILQFTIFTHASIIDPYQEVMMISANFHDTLVAKMWRDQVNFVPHAEIEEGLDYTDFTHKAPNVELYHAPIKNLSKSFFRRLDTTTSRVDVGTQIFLDQFSAAVDELFPGKEHIFCTNKHPNEKQEYSWSLEGETHGRRVITNPHGWNHLQEYHMAVFAAAINYDPETTRRLKAIYGITAKEAKNAIAHQLAYQFSGRTSFRTFGSKEKIVLILPDEHTAEYMQSLIGCAASKPLPMYFYDQPKRGRPAKKKAKAEKAKRVPKTEEERREADRLRKQRKRAEQKSVELRV